MRCAPACGAAAAAGADCTGPVAGARRLRKGIAAYVSAAPFEGSGLQASLALLELPAALLSGKTLVWYNGRSTASFWGEGAVLQPVNRVLPAWSCTSAFCPAANAWKGAGRRYTIFASSLPRRGKEDVTLLYLVDDTP